MTVDIAGTFSVAVRVPLNAPPFVLTMLTVASGVFDVDCTVTQSDVFVAEVFVDGIVSVTDLDTPATVRVAV